MRWDASDYEQHSSAQYEWAAELVAKLGLSGGERVLDIGSGDGKVTAHLASLLPRGSVVGLDRSEAMVGHANDRFPRSAHPNLTFRLGDAAALDFDSEFDVVFSNATLHWIKDHRPVLHGIHRALKPGGRTLLQMGGRGNAADIMAAMETIVRRNGWAGYFVGHTNPYGFHGPEEYRSWLAAAGLEPRRVELILKQMRQDGRDGLAGWLRTTWMPYTHRVPEDLRDRFVNDVLDEYLAAHPADPAGKVHVQMVRLEVDAVKPDSRSASERSENDE